MVAAGKGCPEKKEPAAEHRWLGGSTATSGNFVYLLRSIGAVQLDRHPPFHFRPHRSVFQAATVSTPNVWDGLMRIRRAFR